MTDKIQLMTITLMTTILFTGGIVPYSFANNDDDYDHEACETPSILEVMYNGPDNAHVEIYKLKKHAKNNDKMLYEFPQYFNDGEYIKLNSKDHMDRDELKKKTTYKITHGSSSKYLTIDTSCRTPLAIGDTHSVGDDDDDQAVKLTVMYGGDLDEIPVIYNKYHDDKPPVQQVCEDGDLIDFTSPSKVTGIVLGHGALHGEIVDYLDEYGFTYSVESSKDIGSIFDSTWQGSTTDPDLVEPRPDIVPSTGNLLIIQEHTQPSDPDDDAKGGTHTLETQDGLVNLESIRVIDIDNESEANSFVRGHFTNDQGMADTITHEFMPPVGNNNQELIHLQGFDNLNKIEVFMEGSGAVTNFCVTSAEPPAPGTIKITKDTVPDSTDEFVFQTDIPLPDDIQLPGESDKFALTDDGDPDPPVNMVSFTLPPGEYSVEELPVDTHSLSIECNGVPVDNPDNPREAIINLVEGGMVECIFTNDFIPPPTGTITIKKAITNDNGGLATPSDFEVTLTPTDGGLAETQQFIYDDDPTMGAVTFEDIPVGTYVMTEEYIGTMTSPTYNTVLIAGDTACPVMEDEEFEISEGEPFTCLIYNDDDFVEGGSPGPAPTVFVNSTVIDPSITASDFMYIVGNNPAKGNNSEFTIEANTPAFFSQTNNPDILPTKIIGDGNCPEVLIGVITLSAGQNISCTLVYGKEIEPGVIFHFDNVKFVDTFGTGLGQCPNTGVVLPCVISDSGLVKVFPDLQGNEKLHNSTLVVFSVTALDPDTSSSQCTFKGISSMQLDLTMGGLTDVPAFEVECAGSDLQSEDNPFVINFALIETLMPGEPIIT